MLHGYSYVVWGVVGVYLLQCNARDIQVQTSASAAEGQPRTCLTGPEVLGVY